MKLHYAGKYDLNEASLPQAPHHANAVRFREADNSRELAVKASAISVILLLVFAAAAIARYRHSHINIDNSLVSVYTGMILSLLLAFPHEMLHALCFREDVYLYTNLRQGMLFVVGTESMSKGRFIFMSLLPNIVFGAAPYLIGMLYPQQLWSVSLGVMSLSMGAGDYYNVWNAMRQMPKGALTFLSGLHSYWYIPTVNKKEH